MGCDGVDDVSAGAGEGVGGMVNVACHTSGSIARSGACGAGSSVGAETHVDSELAEVRGFLEGDRRGLVRRSWVDGSEERIWKVTQIKNMIKIICLINIK